MLVTKVNCYLMFSWLQKPRVYDKPSITFDIGILSIGCDCVCIFFVKVEYWRELVLKLANYEIWEAGFEFRCEVWHKCCNDWLDYLGDLKLNLQGYSLLTNLVVSLDPKVLDERQ